MALLLQSKSRVREGAVRPPVLLGARPQPAHPTFCAHQMCISLLQSLLEQQQLEVPRKAARATVLASDRAFPPSLVDAIARERRGRRQTTPSTAGADRGLREVGKDLSKRVGAGDEAPTRRKPSSTEGRTRRRAGGKRRHRSRSASDCGGKTRVPAPWASAGPEALAPGADPRAGVALEWVSESAAAARDGRGRAAVDPAVLVGSGSTWAALARSHADWPLVSKPITKLSTLRNLVYGLYERKLKGDLAALGCVAAAAVPGWEGSPPLTASRSLPVRAQERGAVAGPDGGLCPGRVDDDPGPPDRGAGAVPRRRLGRAPPHGLLPAHEAVR